MKWTAVAAALVALVIFVHWFGTQPARPPGSIRYAPPFVEMILWTKGMSLAQVQPDWVARVIVSLVAITGTVASFLALTIALRTRMGPATLRLTASLALGSICAAYFFVVTVHPYYRQLLGLDGDPRVRFLADALGYAAGLCAPWLLARAFMGYPRAPTEEEWRSHFAKLLEEARSSVTSGWRERIYPKWAIRRRGKVGPVGFRRFGDSNAPIPWLIILALVCAAADGVGALMLSTPGAGDMAPIRRLSGGIVIIQLVAFGSIVFGLAQAFGALQYHQRNAVPQDRARIDWIYGTMLSASFVAVAIQIVWFALFPFLAPALERHGQVISFAAPAGVAFVLFGLAFVISIAMSVFYRGAIDPRLAVRKVTVFGVVGLILAFLFVLVERFVAMKVTQWLGLPAESGAIAAGTAIAVTMAPIRSQTEKVVNRFAAGVLPLESVMEGERKVQAVVLCDLSGYTALSARDERQAMLVAALLQRLAGKICADNQGRVVKSMGDAVIMAFPDAVLATKALGRLHEEFAPAAVTLGLEPLQVHSGAHIGEVTQTHDGDLYGQTVNIAARLQSLATPGQRIVSDAFADSAAIGALDRKSLGMQKLKNVPEPVGCVELADYRFVDESARLPV